MEGAILGNYQFTAYRSANGTKPIDVERLSSTRLNVRSFHR